MEDHGLSPVRSVLTACVLACCFAGASLAEDGKPPAPSDAKEFDMHAPYVRYHFTDTDMDFTFASMVLGAIGNGGAETGEAFYTVSTIKDGDAASWQEQWIRTAERAEARGRTSLAAGHVVSARQQLLRASNYYRFGLLAMMTDDPRLRPTAARSRNAMREAGKLFDPPLQYVELPFEDAADAGGRRNLRRGSRLLHHAAGDRARL
jgi:hypothetical protein